jgi:predicted ATPase/DNA-binding winged helix-turn-helix (wHTH) protein
LPDIHRFESIEIHASERRLMVKGRPVQLGARAFDLLMALVERRERVVSRTELLDVAWPGLFVEEGNLAVQVSALRKLLGAHAIATVPGRGYRFTLSLSESGAASEAEPKSVVAAVNALPVRTAALLGRSDDLAVLGGMLHEHRLVTIVGPGGIGKTSLALSAVHEWDSAPRDGIVWVELAPMSDESLLPGAVALALRLSSPRHADPMVGLVAAMQSLEVLLVLDNAEHLSDAVARLAQLVLEGAPGVRLLVTSQAGLRLSQEHLMRLGPLAVPESGVGVDEARGHGAVALFVNQAKAADHRFELTQDNVDTVVSLCRQLDGLALALKLAAARLPFLGLKGLEARLGERMKLLRGTHGDMPTRQQTLMAAMDWSHGLLSAQEQTVFRRLAVFVGGFTLDLACAVAVDESPDGELDEGAVLDILYSLVDRSLVAVDGGDPPRYRLLESAREYAWVRLGQSGEMLPTKNRHTRALTALFEQADADLWTMPDVPWLAQYTPELDNARAAMDWAVQQSDPIAVGLMASMARLLFQLPLGHEIGRRSDAVLPLVQAAPSRSVQARYWVRRSHGQWGIDQGLALAHAQKAADLYRTLGNEDPYGLHESLFAMATSWRLPTEQMAQTLDELHRLEQVASTARTRADRKVAQVMGHYTLGAFEEMFRDAQEGVFHAGQAGSMLRVNILQWYACTALRGLGRVDEALAIGRDSIAQVGQWRGWSVGYLLGEYVWCCLASGNVRDSQRSLKDFFVLSRSTGWTAFGYHSHLYARMALTEGRPCEAARLLGFAEKSWRRIGTPFPDMARVCSQLHSELAALLDPATLTGLLAAGAMMNEDAACALALPGTANACGSDKVAA